MRLDVGRPACFAPVADVLKAKGPKFGIDPRTNALDPVQVYDCAAATRASRRDPVHKCKITLALTLSAHVYHQRGPTLMMNERSS